MKQHYCIWFYIALKARNHLSQIVTSLKIGCLNVWKVLNKQTAKQLLKTAFWNFKIFEKNDQPISNWNNSMNIAYIEAMKLELASIWLKGSSGVKVEFDIFVWISTKKKWSHSKICCFFHVLKKRLFLAFRK